MTGGCQFRMGQIQLEFFGRIQLRWTSNRHQIGSPISNVDQGCPLDLQDRIVG
ncbi:MAG: hypothetical protein CM1200mP20_10510 [Pseudomonadota bacterium]|nr:MAG: hypothetical protein CM1200mP20_10510 [Pseudomonadota bacterium]